MNGFTNSNTFGTDVLYHKIQVKFINKVGGVTVKATMTKKKTKVFERYLFNGCTNSNNV